MPGAVGRKKGHAVKCGGVRYTVLVDTIAGYLRIIDKQSGSFVALDGKGSRSKKETHFKILKRKDM